MIQGNTDPFLWAKHSMACIIAFRIYLKITVGTRAPSVHSALITDSDDTLFTASISRKHIFGYKIL